MQNWPAYFWVATGGALGSVGRYWLSGVVAERAGDAFPWGTLMVNVSGAVLIGFLAGLSGTEGRRVPSSVAQQFLMAGICGGYTTFSAFSLQTFRLMRNGDWIYAGGNVLASVLLCLAGVWLGYLLGAALRATKAG